jgi:hypothetical protein
MINGLSITCNVDENIIITGLIRVIFIEVDRFNLNGISTSNLPQAGPGYIHGILVYLPVLNDTMELPGAVLISYRIFLGCRAWHSDCGGDSILMMPPSESHASDRLTSSLLPVDIDTSANVIPYIIISSKVGSAYI